VDIDRLKRILIGPLALLFIILVCAWNYRPDSRFLEPLRMHSLAQADETVNLPERGRYVVFYSKELDLNAASNPYDVEDSVNKSQSFTDLSKAVGATRITVMDADGKPLKTGNLPGRLLYKAGSPPKWIWGRPIFAITTLRPGQFQIHIDAQPEVKQASGVFALGSLTRPDTFNGMQVLISSFAIPAGMLAYLWLLLAASPWGFLADKLGKKHELTKMKPAGQDATIGRVRMAMIPTQRLLFLETGDGIYFAISGLAHHLGFSPIFIPWDKFTEAKRKGEFLEMTVAQPRTNISIRANLLMDAEKSIRPQGRQAAPTDNEVQSFAPDDAGTSEPTLSEAETTVAGETTVAAEPLPRAQRAGLGIGLIMMGILLGKFFVFDTLQAAHQKMAKVTVIDGLVCFAPFTVVVGIIILVHAVSNKPPAVAPPTGGRALFWQIIGGLIAIPILAFWLWFKLELSRLGYPFFGH